MRGSATIANSQWFFFRISVASAMDLLALERI
jgi:hypothetical protein